MGWNRDKVGLSMAVVICVPVHTASGCCGSISNLLTTFANDNEALEGEEEEDKRRYLG